VIPKAIIKTNRGNARVWLVNPLNEDVKIRAGCILTSVEEITETRFDQLCVTEVHDDNQASRSSIFTDLNLDHLPSNQKDKLKSMLMSHKRLFDGEKGDLGIVPGIYHHIPTGDTSPIITRQWRLPQTAKQVIKDECGKMLMNNVIEPSNSPWMSPIVLVRKKDNSFRFCIDFRNLNAHTTADSYPLPRMEEMIDELGQSVQHIGP